MPFGSTARSFYFLSCITVPDFSVTFYFPDLFTSRIYLPSGVFSWYYPIFFLFTDRSHLAIITWLTDYLDLSTSRANALRLPCKPDKFLFFGHCYLISKLPISTISLWPLPLNLKTHLFLDYHYYWAFITTFWCDFRCLKMWYFW